MSKRETLWVILLSFVGAIFLIGLPFSYATGNGAIFGVLLIALLCLILSYVLALLVVTISYQVKGRYPRSSTKLVVDMTPSEYESHVGWVFSQWGFGNVKVMGGTGDFGADVLCTDDGGNKVCIQCKKYAKPVGVSAVQEVIGARGFYGCQRAMVVTTVGFTSAARQLAEKNGVELLIVN